MKVETYLFFDGRCDEAIEFYKRAVGAEVNMLMRYKDSPEKQPGMIPPGGENKVMHGNIRIGDTNVLVSDGQDYTNHPKFDGFSLAISVASDEQAKKVFNALGEGGKVNMPLTRTFFSSSFGMLNDKFGVGWMVMVASESKP